MLNPSDLYRLENDIVDAEPQSGVLLMALGGFLDAGQVQSILTDHLVETSTPELIATFDADQLIDYRGRRPTMIFDQDRYTEYEERPMLLRRLTDRDGHTYFLLSGPEPDFQWERVVAAIKELMDRLGVRLVVSAYGIPMGVPHTRPVGFTAHGTDPSLIQNLVSPFGKVQVPGSLGALLELRLGESGQDAAGFAIHVPRYLAASEFPEGALTALNAVVDATGLNLPNDALVAKAEAGRSAIGSAVEENEEIRVLVQALEQQYDAFMAGSEFGNLAAPGGVRLPAAEELGAEFEDFLRTLSEDDG